MAITPEQFQSHLKTDHHRGLFSSYLKEIIYGGNDGIVTTFAVVAGYSGANIGSATVQLSVATVMLFGLANLFADATAMGLGNFLSIRSEQEIYKSARRYEEMEVATNPKFEREETIFLLKQKGFSAKDAADLTAIYEKNPEFWVDFMMHYELEMPDPTGESALFNGMATFLSFVVFGSIPLLPYVITTNAASAFIWSATATFFALILLGSLRSWVSRENWFRAVIEVVMVGGVSSIIAYGVGTLFK